MATKFTVEGDVSQATAALDAVKTGVKGVGDQAAQASAQLAGMESATQSEANAAKDAAKSAEELAKSVTDTKAATEKAVDTTTRLTAVFTGIQAGISAFRLLGRAVGAAKDAIHSAAESGDADMKRLDESINSVGKSWDTFVARLTSGPGGSDVKGFFADWADGIAGGLDGLHELDESLATFGWDAFASAMDAVGWDGLAANARKNIDLIAETNRKAEEAFQEEQKRERIRKQGVDADKVAADFRKQQAEADAAAAIAQITSQEEINKAIEDELKLLKDLAEQDQLTADQQLQSKKKLASLDQQSRKIKADAAAEEKRLAAEVRAKKDEEERIHEEYVAKQLEERVQKLRDELAEELRLEAEAAAERKRRVDELSKSKEVQGVAAKVQGAAGDQQAVIERLASNAGEKGSDEYRKAYRQATMQARGGAKVFSDDQIKGAIEQNASAQVDALGKSLNVSQDVLDALKQNVQATQQFDLQQDRMAGQVEQILQVLGDVNKNSRTRAQKMGAKQI